MNAGTDLIVRGMDRYYEVFVTRTLTNPKLYFTQSPHTNHLEYLCDISGNYMMIADPLPDRRIYFVIQSEHEKDLVAAPSRIALEGVENFRDMGGYIGDGGKQVKWGHFFRSGALSKMDEQEKSSYEAMNFKSILDYRVKSEAGRSKDHISGDTIYYNISALKFPAKATSNTSLSNMDMESQLRAVQTDQDLEILILQFRQMYHILPFNNSAYRKMFSIMDNHLTPFNQHCTAGKDRTGVGCALLLLSLGVDRQTVIEDFLLSALYREKSNQLQIPILLGNNKSPAAIKAATALLSVQKDLIEAFFEEIDIRYTSFEEFLSKEYQITENRIMNWRKWYLF